MTTSLMEQRYSDLLSRSNGPGKKVITSYQGEMDQEKVSMLSYAAEHQLDTEGARRGTIKKIFNILIEVLQNVLLHSASPEIGKPFYFILSRNMEDYVVTCANIVKAESAIKIKSALEEMKKMNEKQLKNHYMEVLSNDTFSAKGGAGLGLITVAIKSVNNFTFEMIPLNNDVSIFEISAIVPDK
jgi:hypothetical protein